MLTAAFASREAATSDVTDLGSIFRIITGSRLRDVDEDGNLIEQIESASTARFGMPDSEDQLRRSVDIIGTEVSSLKASVSMLHFPCSSVTQSSTALTHAPARGSRCALTLKVCSMHTMLKELAGQSSAAK